MAGNRIIRSGVYQIVNEVNGKSYVGSSKDITGRWSQWRANFAKPMKYKSLLKLAVQKYGIENFTFIILEQCEPTKEILEARENHYIETLKPAYNILQKAYSNAGHKLTEEQVQRMKDNYSDERKLATSIRSKTYMSTPEQRARYSQLRKGKTFEEIFGPERAVEVLQKQSENRIGKRVGFDPWNKGIPMDEEQKLKCSISQLERYQDGYEPWNKGTHGLMPEPWNKGTEMSDEIRAKVSQAVSAWYQNGGEAWNKGVPMTEEQRLRLYEAAKPTMFDPQHQAIMTEAARLVNTGVPLSEQRKQKISESNRNSEARKAFAATRKDVPRTAEVRANISSGQRSSEKCEAYHQGRIGKMQKRNTSGHYGLIWDKTRNKWQVRIRGKVHGRFADLDQALLHRDKAMTLNM